MELKYKLNAFIMEAERRSNRTFMELKLNLMRSRAGGQSSSNRTFMELKFSRNQLLRAVRRMF